MTDDDRQERDDWSREQYEDEIADGLLSEPVDCVVCSDRPGGCEFCPKVEVSDDHAVV